MQIKWVDSATCSLQHNSTFLISFDCCPHQDGIGNEVNRDYIEHCVEVPVGCVADADGDSGEDTPRCGKSVDPAGGRFLPSATDD